MKPLYNTTRMSFANTMLNEELDTKDYILYDFIYMKRSKEANPETEKLVVARVWGTGRRRSDC